MPKKQEKYSSKEEKEEDDEIASYDDEMDDDSDDNQDREIEVNKKHLLNYESDDSSNGMIDDSDDDLDKGLAKQKEELIMNDTWGSKKRNFYGRDKKQDDASSSSDDEDERLEALRLQKVRAKKLQLLANQQEDFELNDQKDSKKLGNQLAQSSEDEDSSDDSEVERENRKKGKKLGDRLFADEGESKSSKKQQKVSGQSLKELIKEIQNPKMIKTIVEKENPELLGLLEEFNYSLSEINEKLKPILEIAKEFKTEYKNTLTYIEMRHNLLLSYCTFLSFYLLLKVDSKPVQNHPVLFKLTHIKSLLDNLAPVDEKLQKQINKMLKRARKQEKKRLSQLKQKQALPDDVEEYDEEEDNESEEIDMEEYDVEEESDPENEVYVKKSKARNQEEEEDDEEDIEDDYDEENLEDMDEEMEEDIEDEYDDEQELFEDDKQGGRGISMNIQEIEKLYEIKNGKAVIKSDNSKDQKRDKKDKDTKKSKKQSQNDDQLDVLENKKDKKSKSKPEDSQVLKKKKITFNDLQVTKTAEDDIEGDEVYEAQKLKLREKKAQKKEMKKELKEQELQQVGRMEKDIQRNINYDIMKAKGLTRKRKKIDRNSRVKFREKYRKALIKRGSKVQEYKEGPRGVYSGEGTGLKAGLIKSTSLS
ncbi:UNKNOWN [Stylonychia lemnae]|uniref:Sas10 C-terminal domain-containing protein n=1 Tax=Stylonychia lemnae TaxID=5949 RepID=A0A078AFU6_STYLE|nr:UNKNOWN [Stylonychia lemnae]|eukprot:CDW81145.1 UNKNOWN [Stylonychia lemnae]